MLKISEYDIIIFDFDGVILDSNKIKERNIRKVMSCYLDNARVNEFVNYFIATNKEKKQVD